MKKNYMRKLSQHLATQYGKTSYKLMYTSHYKFYVKQGMDKERAAALAGGSALDDMCSDAGIPESFISDENKYEKLDMRDWSLEKDAEKIEKNLRKRFSMEEV